MTSQKQIEANRKNSLKSTGPNTTAGKAAVSQNATRHGLRSQQIVIQGENQNEFDDFRNLLIAQLLPDNPLETLLVDRIAAGFWRLRRAGRIEAQIFDEMRDTLLIEQKKAPDRYRLITINEDKIGLPSPSPFKSFKEAKSAWDKTPDGIDYAEGRSLPDQSPSDSFSQFLKDSQVPPSEFSETRKTDIQAAILTAKKKFENDPEIQTKLTELQASYKTISQHPFTLLQIPALRQALQDIRRLVSDSDNITKKYGLALDDAINDMVYMEASIDRQLQPNLGQALSFDLKSSNVLSKFVRYETQIERSTMKALHELQRLQAMRLNRETSSPACLDVNISCD